MSWGTSREFRDAVSFFAFFYSFGFVKRLFLRPPDTLSSGASSGPRTKSLHCILVAQKIFESKRFCFWLCENSN